MSRRPQKNEYRNTMSTKEEFWWNWWVTFGSAFATFAAVFVALFGEWIRAHLFSPKLELELKSLFGEKTTVILQWQDKNGETHQDPEDARYYHVKVTNHSRWPNATQVQVYLTRVEEPGPDRNLQITWAGEIPIHWRHQAIHPLSRTIGHAIDCDLCSVVKEKWVQLHPLIVPNNLEVIRRNPTTMVVSLQARSNEGDSKITKFEISWDGKWDDGDKEMTQHLIVKKL